MTYSAAVRTATFEIYKDRAGYYRWRLKGGNGEIVAASEGYSSRENAKRGAETVKRIAPSATIQDIYS